MPVLLRLIALETGGHFDNTIIEPESSVPVRWPEAASERKIPLNPNGIKFVLQGRGPRDESGCSREFNRGRPCFSFSCLSCWQNVHMSASVDLSTNVIEYGFPGAIFNRYPAAMLIHLLLEIGFCMLRCILEELDYGRPCIVPDTVVVVIQEIDEMRNKGTEV